LNSLDDDERAKFNLGQQGKGNAISRLDDDEKSTLRISEGGPERNIIDEKVIRGGY
jgi:hypothetical protein